MRKNIVDLIGIGIGPANLGLAALLDGIAISHQFFDAKKTFTWHEGISVEYSDLQVHYLKDLVTLVSPTNRYSFLAFLAEHQRIYQFLNQNQSTVSRKEYEQYYQWVASKLPHLNFNAAIDSITYEYPLFKIMYQNHSVYCRHLAIGVGNTLNVPLFAEPYLSDQVLHSASFKLSQFSHQDKTICVVGGGQSAAEIIYTLMTSKTLPSKIYWINKRYRFNPLEDSCFSNEYYTPSYCESFYKKDKHNKTYLNQLLFDTNNGITLSLLDKIYRLAYQLNFIEQRSFQLILLPAHTCHRLSKKSESYQISVYDSLNRKECLIKTDKIIFSTGYQKKIPIILQNLFPTLSTQDYPVNADFSLPWEYQATNKIYLQNAASHHFSLSDTNLGIFSWRNAMIINSLLNKPHFKISDHSLLLSQPFFE